MRTKKKLEEYSKNRKGKKKGEEYAKLKGGGGGGAGAGRDTEGVAN